MLKIGNPRAMRLGFEWDFAPRCVGGMVGICFFKWGKGRKRAGKERNLVKKKIIKKEN